jgi:hypothetical protein
MKYERLTKRNRRGFANFKNCNEQDCIEDCGCCKHQHEINNRLLELEDKIENGTLIELPCKVGDTVFRLDINNRGELFVEELLITEIKITVDMLRFIVRTKKYAEATLYRNSIGATWFLTKAEAEKKLKELQGE